MEGPDGRRSRCDRQGAEAIPAYKAAFETELGGPPTGDRIVKALATFVRTIHAGDTPWDDAAKAARRRRPGAGFDVFSEVAQCTLCHLPPVFSDTLFHNVGVGFDNEKPGPRPRQDPGGRRGQGQPAGAGRRGDATGAFKTPSLRGVALTGPYFHDGRAATLEEAVDFMLNGGVTNPHLDEKLQKWPVTAAQRKELLGFLNALSPKNPKVERPQLP